MSPAPEDRWARRRAALRAAAANSGPEEEPNDPRWPGRPSCLTASVALWLVLGGLLLLIGIADFLSVPDYFASSRDALPWGLCLWIVLGAINLRAGFRGARYALSVATGLLLLVVGDVDGLVFATGGEVWGAVLALVLVVCLAVPATVLMWLPAANYHIQLVRQYTRLAHRK